MVAFCDDTTQPSSLGRTPVTGFSPSSFVGTSFDPFFYTVITNAAISSLSS